MNIQNTITSDLKKAMIDKDTMKKSILRVVIGEFNRIDKEVDDDKALSIIKKMVANATENGHQNEIDVLSVYLPKQLSETELKNVISSIIDDNDYNSMKNMGLIMKTLKDNYGGQYDGKLASNIVKQLLS